MTPRPAPDYAGITDAARRIAKAERAQPEVCWKDGCDRNATHDYWCEPHYAQRREHIRNEMAKLAEEEFEVKRLAPHDTTGHAIEIHSAPDYATAKEKWWWKCSCGSEGQSFARTEGIARSAGKRHLRGVGVTA